MKNFDDVYQAWMNENIAEAKAYVKELNKLHRKSQIKAAAAAKTKSFAPARRSFADDIEGELKVRLTA